jgi:hypothetical protein
MGQNGGCHMICPADLTRTHHNLERAHVHERIARASGRVRRAVVRGCVGRWRGEARCTTPLLPFHGPHGVAFKLEAADRESESGPVLRDL